MIQLWKTSCLWSWFPVTIPLFIENIFQLLHQTRIILKTYHSVSLSFTFLSSSGCFQSQCKLYYVLTKLYSVQKHQWPLTWWWEDRLNIWYLSFPHQAVVSFSISQTINCIISIRLTSLLLVISIIVYLIWTFRINIIY